MYYIVCGYPVDVKRCFWCFRFFFFFDWDNLQRHILEVRYSFFCFIEFVFKGTFFLYFFSFLFYLNASFIIFMFIFLQLSPSLQIFSSMSCIDVLTSLHYFFVFLTRLQEFFWIALQIFHLLQSSMNGFLCLSWGVVLSYSCFLCLDVDDFYASGALLATLSFGSF